MTGAHTFDLLLSVWTFCEVEDREAFVAYLRVSGVITEPVGAAVSTGNDLREPAAAASGQIVREGDAPRETDRFGGDASRPDTELKSDGGAIAAVTGKAQLANANSVEPPPSDAFTNPRCQQPHTCHFVHTRDDCFDCSLAWSKRPKDEQRRLWAEANEAAKVAA